MQKRKIIREKSKKKYVLRAPRAKLDSKRLIALSLVQAGIYVPSISRGGFYVILATLIPILLWMLFRRDNPKQFTFERLVWIIASGFILARVILTFL